MTWKKYELSHAEFISVSLGNSKPIETVKQVRNDVKLPFLQLSTLLW